MVRREKYAHECPELIEYQKKHVTEEQRESVNLDDHTAYLNSIQEDKSLYPYRNVMSCNRLVQQLKNNHWDKKAADVQVVIDKGLNRYAPTGLLSPSAPVISPLYFIWVIQKSNSKILDQRDESYEEDQNIGLHDLVSQLSMRQVTTKKWPMTINGHTYQIPLDAGYCPFCAYHAGCHRMLNNHVWIHLWMPMFCRVGSCFHTTSDSKAMIAHAVAEHSDVYLKSKELTNK